MREAEEKPALQQAFGGRRTAKVGATRSPLLATRKACWRSRTPMKTMASSPHRMTTDNQGVHFFSLLSRTPPKRSRQKKGQNAKHAKDRKQAQMPRAASASLPYPARQRRPRAWAGAAGRPVGSVHLRFFAVLCVLCVLTFLLPAAHQRGSRYARKEMNAMVVSRHPVRQRSRRLHRGP